MPESHAPSPSNAPTRRSVLRGGGAAAGAVVVGLAAPEQSRAAGSAAHTGLTTPASAANLRTLDPHTFTTRSSIGVARHPGLSEAASPRPSVRILPIDRAKFLVNALFDLRVEATGIDPMTARIEITVENESGPLHLLRGTPLRTSSEPGSLEVTYQDVYYPSAGKITITATVTSGASKATAKVHHEAVTTHTRGRGVKNVIFFLGDGMGQPAVTAARILSKGMTEGKYHSLLEMDVMDHRGLVTTSGYDSIATDSANSMSAYMTGHKSSVNAMGVYEGNAADPAAHPRVETLAEIVKRSRGMAVGIVTTAEIQDATPAAVFAHTRRRSEYASIMDQALQPGQMPDVYLGGGLAALLPKTEKGSEREDNRDLRKEFKAKGFTHVTTRAELKRAMKKNPGKLLGTFHTGHLNVYLDREHHKKAEVLKEWNDQPTLMEMTRSALSILEKRKEGFFLMVEAASIDKMEHPLDGPRAVYDCIELDKCVGIAKEWAAKHGDTLIVVTADHNHAMSIVGTHDRRGKPSPDREGNGVYGDAGFPTYVDSDGDGFPDSPDPDVQLFYGWSNHPDHSDDFQHNETFAQPALADARGRAVDNPKRDPGALVQVGNLPYKQSNCVHTVEDVSIVASGHGSERFNGVLDNTEVFFAIAHALGLKVKKPGATRPS
ncbi:alkaline phosphatase [Gephyromycinifex aptenodytis]|uniref:alkaline phosphatase n=1 Tax=Gephyromycinifex aptenodytis TaxID=2716227 RepID=UPI001447D296|nr:alkaline phosphatase [Gephyromycinifex aptenodytis]